MLHIQFLGQFDLRFDDRPITVLSRPAQNLFAYLVLGAGTAFRREKLSGVLWPDSTERDARNNLRHALWRLRQSLELDGACAAVPYLLVDTVSIAFDARSDYGLDVATLQKAHNERATVEELIGSLAVYHGELLPGFYDEWVALERARMQSIFEQKMARLLAALIDERRWTDVLDWAERWIACGETSELAYRALMMAHHARGDLSKVAAAWQRCVQAMRKQLGMEPSAKTLALYEQMRKGASRLAFSSASAKESLSPLGLVDRRSPGYDRRKSPRLI